MIAIAASAAVPDLGTMATLAQSFDPSPPVANADKDADPAVGQAARAAALVLFQSGLARRGGFDEAMIRAPFVDLPVRERAFARALAAIAFRRLGPIDRLLQARLKQQPPALVLDLLRLGAAQLLFMDTPAHAAVHTSVEHAASRNDGRPFKGLVNAVLRSLVREGPIRPDAPELSPEAHAPAWLFSRWRAAYGQAVAVAIAARIAEEPPTDLTLADLTLADPTLADPDIAASLMEMLPAERLAGGTLRTLRRGDLADWPGFAEGRWWVQDAAAALPARLLAVQPGESVLDLCAAPGGKTLQLAAAGGRVTALDRSAARLKRLSANLSRIGLSAEIVAAEAATWDDPRTFDAVLLDAPCSATGTFRRHPDVLWAAKPGDIGKLAALQARMLDAAAERVRPGGRLIYCVCSLEREEGEDQAGGFLKRHPEFTIQPIAPGEGVAAVEASTADGTVRLHPGLAQPAGGVDGFFIARFIRVA